MIEISLPIPLDQLDPLDELLLEHGDARWTLAQDLPAGSARLLGFFESGSEAEIEWRVLAGRSTILSDSVPAVRELPTQEWRDSYKIHFKAWQFGRLHWVPIWERDTYALPPGDAVLWLDPGLAFGTGNHETTRLCVERLVALAENFGMQNSGNPRPKTQNPKPTALRVVDAGCGSGILALSAARLGFSTIAAFDNDPEAVRVSEENAALNDLAGRVDFFVGDLVTGLQGRTADILLANIQADVLQKFARQLTDAVAPGGVLILSGILARELGQVRTTFSTLVPAWSVESRTMGEWSDLQLIRPS